MIINTFLISLQCLQKAFNKTMDAVVNYVLFETK